MPARRAPPTPGLRLSCPFFAWLHCNHDLDLSRSNGIGCATLLTFRFNQFPCRGKSPAWLEARMIRCLRSALAMRRASAAVLTTFSALAVLTAVVLPVNAFQESD